jgi:hypothetical protein
MLPAVGTDGSELSRPGSSVVADEDGEWRREPFLAAKFLAGRTILPF